MSATSAAVAAIEERILTLRGRKVLVDSDLAALYGVPTKRLLGALRRNRARFPADFVFQLSNQEVTNLRTQFASSSSEASHGGRRFRPFAFTEQGVAMLSSVLRSPVAIAVNIEIMRAFVRLRRAALVSEQVVGLIAELSKRVDDHDAAIKGIIEMIRTLIEAPKPSRRAMGSCRSIDPHPNPHPQAGEGKRKPLTERSASASLRSAASLLRPLS